MSEAIKVGTKVEIIGKNLKGTVAYIGSTMFAAGKWIGVVLDVPMGKNDGSVQGKRYFNCRENCGVFVRQQHIKALSGNDAKQTGSSLKPPSERHRPRSQSPSKDASSTPSKVLSKPEPEAATPVPEKPEEVEVKTTSMVQELKDSLSSNSTLVGSGVSIAEVESLKAQVKDWKDKFETIRLKRQADREKVKDLEKSKIQVQQLMEYKTRMSEQNQDLLKQLRDAKKEAKEAIESKDRYMEEMSDVHEAIEMATLDKEMAEEKVESLQVEVDSLKEKVEELQTDLEIIKAEAERGDEGAPSNYQMKQLEEQNSRLKEALVRMRDLSAAEKMEHQNLEKRMEKKSKELDEIRKKNEVLSEELEKAESTIDELKEQVDIAQLAEEMVEELTDKNLKLEEKLMDYEEQVHDLETMNEMNEELQENARENEMELREEVDLARSRMRNAQRKVEAANDTINDYQDTIKKFRKLVQELQETNEELRQQQSEGVPINPEPRPHVDYQVKIIETKTAARALDLELRKIDAQQAKDHVRYLSMFMPTAFSQRGGDGECVEVLLLAQRLSRKADMIARNVSDKFDISSIPDAHEDLLGVRGDQLSFAAKLICDLVQMHVMMDRYETALNHCSVDLFQKIGTLHSEMAPHERVLDYLIDQLRRDALDETTSIENLSKAVEFFEHLYSVHMAKESFMDCRKLLDDHIKQSNVLLQSIQVNSLRLRCFLGTGHDRSDIFILLKDMKTASSDITQFCKKLRRRLPQISDDAGFEKLPTLEFTKEVASRMHNSEENLRRIHYIMFGTAANCSSRTISDDNVISPKDLQQMFLDNCKKYFEVTGNGHDTLRRSVGDVMASMNSLVTSLQEGEFDSKDGGAAVSPPIARRAHTVKSEASDSEGLASKLSDKDVVIQELRKSLKLKVAEIGEVRVKIGMLERKLEKSDKVEQEQLGRLQNENDNLKDELKKKDKEYDETLDALQRDIDTLEFEKSELKQRLTAQSKRSITAEMKPGGATSAKSNIATILAGAAVSQGSSPGAQVIVEDSPLMLDQIKSLQVALQNKRFENYQLKGKSLCDRLKALEPIEAHRKHRCREDQAELQKLQINLKKLKAHIISIACSNVVDVSRNGMGRQLVGSKSPSQQLFQEQLKLQIANEKTAQLQIKAFQLMAAVKRV